MQNKYFSKYVMRKGLLLHVEFSVHGNELGQRAENKTKLRCTFMGWGVCFDLDPQGRVYCVDGCKWRAPEAYYPWPSARQVVLEYFEYTAHRTLDMIRDECPGTAEALKDACEEYIGRAVHAYASLTNEEKIQLHLEKMEHLKEEVLRLEQEKKEAYDILVYDKKMFKEYKPPTKTPKTRLKELENTIQPLQLELNIERAALKYKKFKDDLARAKRDLKLEKTFSV